jgi:hypothetical protein
MIVVGTTLTAFAMDQQPLWASWLTNLELLKASHNEEVCYFAAIEVDKRGLEPFKPLIDSLNLINGQYFSYSYDDTRTEVTSGNRIPHICAGRNIVQDFALARHASHILFLDSDTTPDQQTFPKLLEMNHDLVGGEVGTYCLSGPVVDKYPFPVQEHWNTAGYLLASKRVYSRIRWRWDWSLSDDPCYAMDAKEFLGVPTYVRKDCIGRHYPECISPLENRGYNRTVVI